MEEKTADVNEVRVEMKKSVVVEWKDEEDPALVLEAARARQYSEVEGHEDHSRMTIKSESEIGEYKPQYSDEPEVQVEDVKVINSEDQTKAMLTYLR